MEITRNYLNNEYPCDTCIHEGSVVCASCGTVLSPSGKVTKPKNYKCRFGRKKYDIFAVPKHVSRLVTMLIAGYSQRKKSIEMKKVSTRVATTYENLNACVDQALESIEPALQRIILYDFEHNLGYKYSQASNLISINSYFRRKRRLIYDVAKLINML